MFDVKLALTRYAEKTLHNYPVEKGIPAASSVNFLFLLYPKQSFTKFPPPLEPQ